MGAWERETEGVWVCERGRGSVSERGSVGKREGEGLCVRGSVGEREGVCGREGEGERETGRVFGRVWKSSEKGHRVCVWDEALDVAKSR